MTTAWVKKEAQRNELEEWLKKTVEWFQIHRQQALIGLSVVAVALALVIYMVVHYFEYQEIRQNRLSQGFHSMMSGQQDQALSIFNELLARTSKDQAASFAYLYKASLLSRQNKAQEAVDTLGVFLEKFPSHKMLTPLALLQLAALQETLGELTKSRETYQKIIDQFPEHYLEPNAHDGLARISLLSNDKEQAKRHWEKLVSLYPNSGWSRQAQARLDSLK